VILNISLYADDYSFDMDEIEVKTYEYSGYVKLEQKHLILDDDKKNSTSAEVFLDYKYFIDDYTFQSDFMANYINIDGDEKDTYTVNQLFTTYKYDNNNQFTIGKKTAKWGKGYFFNPIAFIDKKKDPNNPELSREGFVQLNYKYNKVYHNDLKNMSVEVVYIEENDENAKVLATKLYLLYKDIDIDFAYLYSDEVDNKLGVDFSTNLQTNFEIHGELVKDTDSLYSILLGTKYLTLNDLTITSEYFYQNEQQQKITPFWDNKYFINKFSQKEPFDILYLSTYYKNTYNINDNSNINNLGIVYTKIKNMDIDLSINKNIGDIYSEFGSKSIEEFIWLQLKYSF